MTKYGSPEIKIEVDGTDNTGMDMKDLSEYVDTINEINIEALLQEGHAFGDDWVKQLFTGIKRGNAITLEGFYDDTATTGPDAVLNSIGDTRKVKITYDGDTGAKYTYFDAVIQNYIRRPVRGELTRYACPLMPTGEMLEDSES